jgi:hypothetical protein
MVGEDDKQTARPSSDIGVNIPGNFLSRSLLRVSPPSNGTPPRAKVDGAKTNTTPKTYTLKSCLNKYVSVLRMSTTLRSTGSRVHAFGSSTHKTLNPYNFCTQNSNKMYFGALEFLVNCSKRITPKCHPAPYKVDAAKTCTVSAIFNLRMSTTLDPDNFCIRNSNKTLWCVGIPCQLLMRITSDLLNIYIYIYIYI